MSIVALEATSEAVVDSLSDLQDALPVSLELDAPEVFAAFAAHVRSLRHLFDLIAGAA